MGLGPGSLISITRRGTFSYHDAT